MDAWATDVAERRADVHPRVVQAQQDAAEATQGLRDLAARHVESKRALCRELGFDQSPRTITARAENWRGIIDRASGALTAIEALPTGEAAQLIRDRAAQAAAEAAAEALRATRAAATRRWSAPEPVHHASPQRDFGPRL